MNYVVVMPWTDKKLMQQCLVSLDPNIRDHILLVDNSVHNQGVAKAWNIGAETVIELGYDYLIILSSTMVFEKGMRDLVDNLVNPFGHETVFGWHCIAIGRPVFEKIGLFDENFYPAYYEDSDFIRRMELAQIHSPIDPKTRLPLLQVAAHTQGTANSIKSGVKVNMRACRDYFVSKWGADPLYENQAQRDTMYSWPFNDPSMGLDYWPKRGIPELKKAYQL